jgi:hypothetical protein
MHACRAKAKLNSFFSFPSNLLDEEEEEEEEAPFSATITLSKG